MNYSRGNIITILKEKDATNLIYLFIALGIVFLSYFIHPPSGLSDQGLIMLAITCAAAFLWITEAVPLGVTALIIIFLEALTGIMPLATGLGYIAHPVNAIVLVGFLLAAILVESGLDIRIGLVVLYFFAFAIALWLMDSIIPLTKDWLYLVSVFLIVVIVLPGTGFLSWKEAQKKVNWDIIFLVGGGLAMGTGLKNAGVITWMASALTSVIGPIQEVIAILLISFITGVIGTAVICVISATATAFVPLAIGLALSYGWSPVDFALTACLASSLCFLLPANSVSNAMAFGTGYFKTSDLLKCGILLTAISVIIVAVMEGMILP